MPRYRVGEWVSVMSLRHQGERGIVVERKNTWHFGWTYRVRVRNGKDVWVNETDLAPCSQPESLSGTDAPPDGP